MATIFRGPTLTIIYPRRKAPPEYIINVLPLLTSSPVRTFVQDIWPNPARRRNALASDAPSSMRPLLTPAPDAPFSQYEWLHAAYLPAKVAGEPIGRLAPLITPNPDFPFRTYTETRIFAQSKLRFDTYVNLLTLFPPPAVVVYPFSQYEWNPVASPRYIRQAKMSDFTNYIPYIPIPPAEGNQNQPRMIRDPWDRDEWGNFIPGAGMHSAV